MNMTFHDYTQNPMGKANAVMGNREMYRTMYTTKLDKIMVREHGKVDYKTYKKDGKYYCHLKIPSEVVEDFYYDVIIEFRKTKENKDAKSLKDYYVRFYSNDPAFVFTFAHAFIKNDMFIKELSNKMSKQAIKEKADIKNPSNQVGYVKSLYFAFLIMTKRNLFEKIHYMLTLPPLTNMGITHADKKIEERQKAADSAKDKKRKKKDDIPTKKATNVFSSLPEDQSNVGVTPMIGNTGGIKKTGSINRIKKTSKIGKRK